MEIEISLVPEIITHIAGFPVTNTFFMTMIVSAVIITGSLLFRRRVAMVPRGFQNVVESVLEALLDLTDSVTGSRAQTRQFFPIVATIFIFVILSNWVGLLPGMGTFGVEQMHGDGNVLVSFIRSPSADLNLTITLALISVIAAQVYGFHAVGFKGYMGKFFVSPFKKPYAIGTFVGILEIVSEIAKVVSFSFRLFGNVFAGEVLLIVILSLVHYVVPVPFLLLEIFVGFIQALVFSMLALGFFKMATEAHH